MDLDTALEVRNRISVYAAMAEIENHGHSCYVANDMLYGSVEPGKFEMIAVIKNGDVLSRRVMLWLGY